MRVLYRDPSDHTLAVAEVTSTSYFPEEEILQFSGDTDFAVRADKAAAEKLVRSLYLEGRVDVTGYEACEVEFEFDEDDDEDDFDFDEDLEDSISDFLDSGEDTIFRLPHRLVFPGRDKD
ncbi:MAG: hypothetical protein SOZ59_01150 [Candidatus Limivivens sp.]|nr:hypothetical protein [Candidatus Limivivens sp.]